MAIAHERPSIAGRSFHARTAAYRPPVAMTASGGAHSHGLDAPVTLVIAPRTLIIIVAITAWSVDDPGYDDTSAAWSARMCGPKTATGTSMSTAPTPANAASARHCRFTTSS